MLRLAAFAEGARASAVGAKKCVRSGSAALPTSGPKRARSGRRSRFPRCPAHRARPAPRLAAWRERAESGGGPAPATKRRRSRREEVRAAAAPSLSFGPLLRRRPLPVRGAMEGVSALLARCPTAGLAGGLGVTACAAAGVLLYRIARR